MKKDPLRVVPKNPTETLAPSSRVNLAKLYPIEFNFRIHEIGQIGRESLPKLLAYVRDVNGWGLGWN